MSVIVGQNKIVEDPTNYTVFQKLLDGSTNDLLAIDGASISAKNFWQGFETKVVESLKRTKFAMKLGDDWNIDYQPNSIRFPDVVAYVKDIEGFGLEVKTISSKTKRWKVMGGSIMESTRVPGVERIHVLCAKKASPLEIICRRFEDCVVDVAVTHSPRYILDMEATTDIFTKLKTSYNDVRVMENPFLAFKDVIKNAENENHKSWWDLSANVAYSGVDRLEQDFAQSFAMANIKFWSEVDAATKKFYKVRMMIKYPEVILGDYKNASKWLLCTANIMCASMRDSFSAGGSVQLNGVTLPQVYGKVYDLREEIIQQFHDDPTIDFDAWMLEINELIATPKSKLSLEQRRGVIAMLEDIHHLYCNLV